MPSIYRGARTERVDEPTSLAPTLEDACRRWAQRPAISQQGGVVTYQELWARVRALARAYQRLGVGRGDRVMCALRTGLEHVVAMHAAWTCGAVHVGVHNELTAPELCALAGRLSPAALLLQPSGTDDDGHRRRAVAEALPDTIRIVHGGAAFDDELLLAPLLVDDSRGDLDPELPGPGDPGVVFLTSGSTGPPKAVIDTLPGLWGKVGFFNQMVRPGPDDVHLMFLPICHAFGLKLTTLALLSGGRLTLLDRFSPEMALRLVTSERVTVLPATPTHLSLLLAKLDSAVHHTASLRWIPSAAAPLPRPLAEQAYQRLGAEIFYVYGCSEGFLCATTDRGDILDGSVGSTVFAGPPGTSPDGRVGVVDPERHTALPPGELGEIVFGAAHPVRYWDQAAAGRDGWYHTGDLGRLDPDGRLFVLGRRKELVNRGGLKVSVGEIESVLVRHPAVADGAVVPSPDPVLGEAICACVVPAGPDPPTLADVRAFLADSLARHKLPDELCLLERLPRSSIGKLDRAALQSLVADGGAPRERLRPR